MPSHAEIDLRQTTHAELSGDIDQQSDLDAVRLLQRDGVERAAPSGRLAGERLSDLAESRVEERENRTCGQLVHSPAAGRHVVQWPLVIPLHQLGFGALEEGLDQAGDELRGGVSWTSASRKTTSSDVVAASPARIASPLPLGPSKRTTRAPWWSGDGRGVVDRIVVDDDQLIHQLAVREDGVEDRTDGGRFVAGRHDHRDRRLGLQFGDALEAELFAAKRPRDVWAAHPYETTGRERSPNLTRTVPSATIEGSSRATEGRPR